VKGVQLCALTMAHEASEASIRRFEPLGIWVSDTIHLRSTGTSTSLSKAELPDYLKPLLVVGYFVPCRLGELRDLEWHQVEFVPTPGKITLEPGTTKSKLARAMGMIGEMPETLLMQKSIRDVTFFLIVPTFSSMKKGSALGIFARHGPRLATAQGSHLGKRARSCSFTTSGAAQRGTCGGLGLTVL
jgi:hypothetical protein